MCMIYLHIRDTWDNFVTLPKGRDTVIYIHNNNNKYKLLKSPERVK